MFQNFCPMLTCDASIRMNIRRTFMLASQSSPLAHRRYALIMREKNDETCEMRSIRVPFPIKFRSRFDCCSQRLDLVPCQQSTVETSSLPSNHFNDFVTLACVAAGAKSMSKVSERSRLSPTLASFSDGFARATNDESREFGA